jgi:hypothetical protein
MYEQKGIRSLIYCLLICGVIWTGDYQNSARWGCSMANSIPNSGRAVMMRNRRTGAAWLVSFDYRDGSYWHEPQGNLRHIRRPYASRNIEPNLVPAGTH